MAIDLSKYTGAVAKKKPGIDLSEYVQRARKPLIENDPLDAVSADAIMPPGPPDKSAELKAKVDALNAEKAKPPGWLETAGRAVIQAAPGGARGLSAAALMGGMGDAPGAWTLGERAPSQEDINRVSKEIGDENNEAVARGPITARIAGGALGTMATMGPMLGAPSGAAQAARQGATVGTVQGAQASQAKTLGGTAEDAITSGLTGAVTGGIIQRALGTVPSKIASSASADAPQIAATAVKETERRAIEAAKSRADMVPTPGLLGAARAKENEVIHALTGGGRYQGGARRLVGKIDAETGELEKMNRVKEWLAKPAQKELSEAIVKGKGATTAEDLAANKLAYSIAHAKEKTSEKIADMIATRAASRASKNPKLLPKYSEVRARLDAVADEFPSANDIGLVKKIGEKADNFARKVSVKGSQDPRVSIAQLLEEKRSWGKDAFAAKNATFSGSPVSKTQKIAENMYRAYDDLIKGAMERAGAGHGKAWGAANSRTHDLKNITTTLAEKIERNGQGSPSMGSLIKSLKERLAEKVTSVPRDATAAVHNASVMGMKPGGWLLDNVAPRSVAPTASWLGKEATSDRPYGRRK